MFPVFVFTSKDQKCSKKSFGEKHRLKDHAVCSVEAPGETSRLSKNTSRSVLPFLSHWFLSRPLAHEPKHARPFSFIHTQWRRRRKRRGRWACIILFPKRKPRCQLSKASLYLSQTSRLVGEPYDVTVFISILITSRACVVNRKSFVAYSIWLDISAGFRLSAACRHAKRSYREGTTERSVDSVSICLVKTVQFSFLA